MGWKQTSKILLFIFRLVWENDRTFFAFKLVNAVIIGLYPLVNVIYPKFIIDAISMNREYVYIIEILIQFTSLQIGYYVFQSIAQYYDSINSLKLINKISNNILNKMMKLDLSFFDNPESYNDFQKARNEAGTRTKQSFDQAIQIISSVITTASVIYILFTLEWYFFSLIAAVVCVTFMITSHSKRLSYQFTNEMVPINRRSGYLYHLVTSNIFSKELRIFNIGKWIIRKYNTCFGENLVSFKKFQSKILFFNGANVVVSNLQTSIIYAILALKALQKTISIGDFTMYLMAAQTFTSKTLSITNSLTNIYENVLFTENLIRFLALTPQVTSGSLTPPSNYDPRALIELRDVSFKYSGQSSYVIRHLSLRICEYENILIVGANGVGKSTLVKLLLRLYDPIEGEIRCFDHNIRDYDLECYRSQFSVVLQDFNKYAFTLAENIVLRDVAATDEQSIEQAILNSGLMNKFSCLPLGIHTPLTREFDANGVDLSVGEMQKLALARVYAQDAPILIMDEPTSALDPLSEYEMYATYASLSEQRTSIFISHRLACAPLMDRVIVMEGGGVVEEGTHTELMKRNGLYREMFDKQAENYRPL